ncbi:MAG: MBL fold metallo-hydrolase [Elusimicrobia bacterium]|nr:MBL fold metallo-hydrolase [Elusimicrobiota bacterium]
MKKIILIIFLASSFALNQKLAAEPTGVEIIFLGTGAGEFWPSAFCDCPICKKTKKDGWKEFWFYSSILIDRTVLVDAPPAVGISASLNNISLSTVKNVFITHSHPDHLDLNQLTSKVRSIKTPEEINQSSPTSKVENAPVINVYCNEIVDNLAKSYHNFNRFWRLDSINLKFNVVEPFEKLEVDGMIVIPLLANHDTANDEKPLNYIFQKNDKTILYACDTGWYHEQTWKEIQKYHYDVIILECTMWNNNEAMQNRSLLKETHMTLWSFLKFHNYIMEKGLLKPGGKFIATHVAHLDKSILKKILSKHNIQLAYNGLNVILK